MDAVRYWGEALIEDPGRVGTTEALGVDETKFLAAQVQRSTSWVSAVCDLKRRSVIDVVEGRHGPELSGWLAGQEQNWKEAVAVSVTDLHEPFRRTLGDHLPNATAVADPFHVVGVGTRVLDRARRRAQQETSGHRGRKHDPLYRGRKLLTLAAERLDDKAQDKLAGLLAAGDPGGEATRRGPPRKPCGSCTRCGVSLMLPRCGSTGSSRTANKPRAPRSGAWPAPSPSPNGARPSWCQRPS
ncbi:MAG: ISL3 family transposase [Acidimicrobiia bacterium]